ncbi:MAG TPA: hypothetical protein VNN08_16230, partial [Thermoanaerobaculia bacterium]|nr:hypothetical protein [Thermoanaerobaculia bacterium]
MPQSAIFWGTNFENQVTLVSPLLDIMTDRPPRPGSEWVQGSSGVEDAWITGYDNTLTCRAAFIPDGGSSPTSLSGSVGWQAFLDWGRQKNPVRFVPDVTSPLFYVDGCYLVDPTSGFGGLGPDIKRQLTFTIRNPTVDFHRAMRGLMFEYTPGGDITQPVAATFTRASVGTRIDVNALVATDAINILRDRHYVGSLRTALLEASGTNACLQSEALDNASWTKGSSTITANTVAAPSGAVTADAVIEAAATSTHGVSQPITITSGQTVTISCFVKASTRTKCDIELRDAAETNAFGADFDASAGTFIQNRTAGAGVVTTKSVLALPGGWYRIQVTGQVNGGITAAFIAMRLHDASNTVS